MNGWRERHTYLFWSYKTNKSESIKIRRDDNVYITLYFIALSSSKIKYFKYETQGYTINYWWKWTWL